MHEDSRFLAARVYLSIYVLIHDCTLHRLARIPRNDLPSPKAKLFLDLGASSTSRIFSQSPRKKLGEPFNTFSSIVTERTNTIFPYLVFSCVCIYHVPDCFLIIFDPRSTEPETYTYSQLTYISKTTILIN